MPTYLYFCIHCGDQEITQKMTEKSLPCCPICNNKNFKKMFSSVGVSFKGNGFYSTDSRKK